VDDAIAQIEPLAESAVDDRQTQGLLRTWLAQLYAMRGDLELARETYHAASTMLRELGGGLAAQSTSTELAQIELEGGDLAVAEDALRRDYAALTAIGEKYIRSWVIGLLGRVLGARNRYDEVESLSQELEEIAAAEDATAQVDWRGLRAIAIARNGDLARAGQLAHEALEIAKGTDFLTMEAETYVRVADVSRLAGDAAATAEALGEALDLYRRKGDLVSVRRVEALRTP
jgi:ATP/maltotriose-dependent transcriptional regulator MalT